MRIFIRVQAYVCLCICVYFGLCFLHPPPPPKALILLDFGRKFCFFANKCAIVLRSNALRGSRAFLQPKQCLNALTRDQISSIDS